jgi:hypothetical protein
MPPAPILICTHPRSGTHLTIDLLRNNFEECRSWKWPWESRGKLYLSLESLPGTTSWSPKRGYHSPHDARSILSRSEVPIFKTHLSVNAFDRYLAEPPDPRYGRVKRAVQRSRIIYVYRDGRDVLCSLYFWHQTDESKLSPFIREDKNGRSRPSIWAKHVREWLRRSDVYPLKFEDIVADTASVVGRLSNAFSLTPRYSEPVLPSPPSNLGKHLLNRMRVRPESTAILGTKQRPRSKSWKDLLSDEDVSFIARETDGLISELHY